MMLKTISADEVTMGMYVSSVQGNWISHSFWRSRFLVDSEELLAKVRASGSPLVIDVARGRDVVSAAPAPVPASPVPVPAAPATIRRDAVLSRAANPLWRPATGTSIAQPHHRPARVVAPAAFGRADRARAAALLQRSTKVVRALFDDCLQGRGISTPAVLAVVDDIATTLEQNVTAFVSVTRLKAKDDRTYAHSVAVCALMISLARESGVTGEQLLAIGTAGLLHDIGKMSVDDAILKQEGPLTEEQMQQVRRHAQVGFDMLQNESDVPPVARNVCLHHHERLDGSGYPLGLSGDAISPAVRIAMICDVYDALTSDRPYRKGLAPIEALGEMENAAAQFDAALLFRFMRVIGIFPPGKLIRLRSNRLAVVLPARQVDRQPVARAFYSTVEACMIAYEDVVLSDRLNNEQAIAAEDPACWFSADWAAMAARIIAGKPAVSQPDIAA